MEYQLKLSLSAKKFKIDISHKLGYIHDSRMNQILIHSFSQSLINEIQHFYYIDWL